MNRAERRKRTALTLKRRRPYVDGPFGYLFHPDEGYRILTFEEYAEEMKEFQGQLKRLLGRSKNLHPWDCGRTQCWRCNRRLQEGLSRQELKADLDFQEQIEEL